MQGNDSFGAPSGRVSRERDGAEDKTVHCEHGFTREILMIGLVVAMGVLAAAVILLPAVVTT